MIDVLSPLYFFIPAYIANMTPVFVRRIPFLSSPIDLGLKVRGKRLLGGHKTWRGLLAGTITGTLAFWAQQALFGAGFTSFALIDYGLFSVLLGTLMAYAALFGDALESAVKRQLGIAPGKSLFFWDQVDFLLMAALVTIPLWLSDWLGVLIAIAVVFVLTIVVQRLGYLLHLKDDPL